MDQGLAANSTISHYRIVSKIGEGGMGEVYLAEDTRLDRKVAIKMLPVDFAKDEVRLRRFEQEAKATSALNHPNILTVYDFGNHEGSPFIVAEFLDGEELRVSLDGGAIPARKAIDYSGQIVSGLSAAHQKGIVHRDLKPENIFITTDDRVKILDFGLAKLSESRPVGIAGGPNSEDATRKVLTNPGMVMGTVGYMSPEQVRGDKADHRSDIFSFGAIMHEMITGRRAFRRDTMAETMTAILKEEPEELSESNPNISPSLERIVRRCLEKKREQRFQSTADLGFALEALSAPTGSSREFSFTASALPDGEKRIRRWAVITAALVFTAAAAGFAGWAFRSSSTSPQQRLILSIVPPKELDITPVSRVGSTVELSPDGTAIVVKGADGLYVRSFDSIDFYKVPGSETVGNQPFWRGSTSLSFPTSNLNLLSVRLPDGIPESVLAFSGPTRGGNWSDNGTLLLASVGGLYTRGADGKAVVVENASQRNGRISYPDFIPGTEDLIIYFREAKAETGEVWLATMSGNSITNVAVLLKNDTAARFTPDGSGRLLFVKNDNLHSQRLDLSARALVGEPELVVRNVASQPASGISKADFSVSRNGVIAWRTGRAGKSQVTAFDREGNIVGTAGPPGEASTIDVSPKDDTRVFVEGGGGRPWFIAEVGQAGKAELDGDIAWFDLTHDGKLVGRRGNEILVRSVDGGTSSVIGRTSFDAIGVVDISPDGQNLLVNCGERSVCWSGLSPDGTFGEPVLLSASKETLEDWTFSPDGRHVLYRVSQNEPSTGIYVQPFPGPGRRQQISAEGIDPVWRHDGKEILFWDDGAIWSVSVSGSAGALSFGQPQKLFSGARRSSSSVARSRGLAVSADGSRIFWVQGADQPDDGVINVMFGFFDNK